MRDFPTVLRLLRSRRAVSQRRLAELSGVSARHISWLETGRARPSRQMVRTLGAALDGTFRDVNLMLSAAGFVGAYPEQGLDHAGMQAVRKAIELLLRSHDPFPGAVIDRRWDAVLVNEGYARMHAGITGEVVPAFQLLDGTLNVIDAFLGPYRSAIVNGDEAVAHLWPRLQRQALVDPAMRRRLDDLVKELPPPGPREEPAGGVVHLDVRAGDHRLRFFTTFTMLGMPNDITSQELSVELFHPADAATRAVFDAGAAS